MEKLEIMIKLASDRNIDQVCKFISLSVVYSDHTFLVEFGNYDLFNSPFFTDN